MIEQPRRVLRVVLVGLLTAAVSLCPLEGPAQSNDGGDAILAPDPERVLYAIRPDTVDPAIKRYLASNIVIFRRTAPSGAPLLVFMPGTGGTPWNLRRFLDTASRVGYRAIGLMYDDVPAVNVVCPSDMDVDCNAHFREKRIYGTNVTSVIDDLPAESIVSRLTELLRYLAKNHPNDGWEGYLLPDGTLNWSRIAVGGHSQGAGMAAFIAKEHQVYRVVLFSSPWDFHAPNQMLSPWLSKPPATPMNRWYAAYHVREPMAPLIQRAYAALGIPPAQIHALTLEPNRSAVSLAGNMIYHVSVVGDYTTPLTAGGSPAYLPDWLSMLGTP
jgi:hypothetical protein